MQEHPRLIIYHAFNGFLYFPLFLAKELNFLPPGTEFVYTGSDATSIQQLQKFKGDDSSAAVAICDPIAGGFEHIDPHGGLDPIEIIGALISGTPYWICGFDQNIPGASHEDGLREYAAAFSSFSTAQAGTTAFLLTKRFLQHNKIRAKTLPAAFGDEFNNLKNSCQYPGELQRGLVLTSDILHIVRETSRDDKVLFSYARHGRDSGLDPFLNTAITARSQSIRDHPVLLTMLLDSFQ